MIYLTPVLLVSALVLLVATKKASGSGIWCILSLIIGGLWALIIHIFLPLITATAAATGPLPSLAITLFTLITVGLPHLLVMWVLLILAPDSPPAQSEQLQKRG